MINAFNLLPIDFLDGGRLVKLLVAGRSPSLERGFGVAIGALLIFAGWQLESPLLAVLGLLSAVSLSSSSQFGEMAAQLRARWPSMPRTVSDCSEALLLDAAAELRTRRGGLKFEARRKPAMLAMYLRTIHERACLPTLTRAEGALFASLYATLLVAGGLCAMTQLHAP